LLRKLGKSPARPNAVSFHFTDVFDISKLPPIPVTFGHYQTIKQYGMLDNDELSDCVYAGGAHESMIFAMMGGKPVPMFTNPCVVSDYSAVTGYNPKDPNSDQGGDMEEAAQYRRKTGLLDASGYRHKIDAYVMLEPGDVDHLMFSMYLMGAAGMGFKLPSSATQQTDAGQPWSFVRGSQSDGGHYVPGVGRNPAGNIVGITWGQLQEIEPPFYYNYCDEAVAYLSLEILNSHNLSPEAFDLAGVTRFLAALG
jgi:hypothetical protein